ncbi:MAG: hypothetical protein GX811_05620 [Lentisphaerae bacterium]|jgi:hypothetical protein|nr:hypothetical protein [Lentisphaerota bacterium]
MQNKLLNVKTLMMNKLNRTSLFGFAICIIFSVQTVFFATASFAQSGTTPDTYSTGESSVQDHSGENHSTKPYISRDPFWPIGFMPTISANDDMPVYRAYQTSEMIMEQLWQEALSKLTVKGVYKVKDKTGKDYCVAMVNNAMAKENDILHITVQNVTFKIRVRSVDMTSGVKFERIKADK